jgi:maltose alpha-D-glucosyltransferase/alpha-amylase
VAAGATDEPPNRQQGTVFPGEQEETWSFDDQAGAWYFHRFYGFQPDLNWSNPAVRRSSCGSLPQ